MLCRHAKMSTMCYDEYIIDLEEETYVEIPEGVAGVGGGRSGLEAAQVLVWPKAVATDVESNHRQAAEEAGVRAVDNRA